MTSAISVERLSKAYRLGSIGGASLNEDLARWWARLRGRPDPALKVDQEHVAHRSGGKFWALEDVSFEVKVGDVLGIIGRNGAGKSTLLKILSQVTAPTSGQIRVQGRVASLLEVGTGFHPDLSGRENIFLNGAILGMTKAEIRSKFDEIVSFSECELFIDTPVKRYSSGMYVRLAFAVAAHLEPEILIVDEVLAVGDAQFQKKCLGKMGDASREGRTILFVSHSMPAVSALCSRTILMRKGGIVFDGDTSSAVATYHADVTRQSAATLPFSERPRTGSGKGRFSAVEIMPVDAKGAAILIATPGCDVIVRATIGCFVAFEAANVAVEVYDSAGYRVIDANVALHGEFLTLASGERAVVTIRMQDLLLKPGHYRVNLWLGRGGIENIDYVEYAADITFHEDSSTTVHTEVFPGVYQCRFEHAIEVHR